MADFKITIDFIRSVYGNKEFTPLAVPVFAGNEKAYLNECIDTTFVSSVGKFVDRFEEDMAKYTGAKRAVVCVSGTNALHMSLLLAGVKKDERCSLKLSPSSPPVTLFHTLVHILCSLMSIRVLWAFRLML